MKTTKSVQQLYISQTETQVHGCAPGLGARISGGRQLLTEGIWHEEWEGGNSQ